MKIRPAELADHATVLRLNHASVPACNDIDHEALQAIAAASCAFLVTEVAGEVVGFLLALREGAAYDSINYRFFASRYEAFVYVDRIVIDPSWHRQGMGAALYEALISACPSSGPLCCEVNLRPPNSQSLAFHRKQGFVEVARQQTEGGCKEVALLARAQMA